MMKLATRRADIYVFPAAAIYFPSSSIEMTLHAHSLDGLSFQRRKKSSSTTTADTRAIECCLPRPMHATQLDRWFCRDVVHVPLEMKWIPTFCWHSLSFYRMLRQLVLQFSCMVGGNVSRACLRAPLPFHIHPHCASSICSTRCS